MPPPKTRRTHTKSRTGCLECKRRQKKCNEEKPTCSGCAKRSLPCVFPTPEFPSRTEKRSGHPPTTPKELNRDPSVASSSNIPPLVRDGRRSGTPVSPAVAPYEARRPPTPKSLGHFDAEDIALWHQFITETGRTMSGPWEKELPLLGMKCDYLMHGMLSTAALHLSYLDPGQQDKYEYLSAQHQNLALGPFRQAMSTITSENCNQIFAFSVLMAITQSTPSRCGNVVVPSPLAIYKGPANWIVCLRGCGSIFEEAASHITSGPIGILLKEGMRAATFAMEITPLPEDKDVQSLEYVSQHLLNLQEIKDSTTIAELEACTEAISQLRQLLAASSATPDALTRRIFTSIWPAQISDTFIGLLHNERPPALVITAHYCILLKRCHSCWYMEHRAYDLFRAVQQSLAEEWMPYVERPSQVVQGS